MEKDRKLYFSIVILFIVMLVSFLLPFIFSLDYEKVDLFSINSAPSKEHLLGTDSLGRDILARVVYGIRISLFVGIVSMICQGLIGISLGIIGGYFKGKINLIISILIDVVMSFPFLILAIVIASLLGPGIMNLILIISLLQWTEIARIVRGEVLKLKEKDFVKSSLVTGLNAQEIIKLHIIPNLLPQIIVATTISMANAILIEASLSFLGLGVRPPMPSLGNILESAQNISALQNYWWQWIPAGFIVIILVLSINLLGKGLKIKLEK